MLLRNQTPVFQSFSTESVDEKIANYPSSSLHALGWEGIWKLQVISGGVGWGGGCVLPCNAIFLSANNMATVMDSA